MTASGTDLLPPPRVPASTSDDLAWPGIFNRHGAAVASLLQQIEASQWWSPEDLRRHQLLQIQRLLAHARAHVPFYRNRLAAADPAAESGGTLTPEIWSAIPLLTRAEIQAAGERLFSHRIPQAHGEARPISSSGSTGRPVTVMVTNVQQLFWQVFTVRDHVWQRRDLSGTQAVIRSFADGKAEYPDGDRSANWGRGIAGLYRTGPSVNLAITATVEQQAEWLERVRPTYLLTLPSVAAELAAHFRSSGRRLPSLRQVRTMAEPADHTLRDLCREAWGVGVADMYSAQETGYIALQCPEHEHLHVQAEGALVEVLDDDLRPCGPGQVGRVVVTPLHNFATPLIRYEVGDFAEVGDACPCGRGLPVLRRILGRVRNMCTLPDGGRVWPRLTEVRYTEIAPIRQFQVVQTEPAVLEVRLVATRGLTADEEDRLRDLINGRIGATFDIVFRYPDAIPRGPSGKYEEFRSDLPPGHMAGGR